MEPRPIARHVSRREWQFLVAVAEQIDSEGTQPTYRGYCKAVGWQSPNTVRQMIVSLQKKGVISVAQETHGVIFNWRQVLAEHRGGISDE